MAEKKVKEVKTEKKITATAGQYDILRRPVISEKSAKLAEHGAVAFEIDGRAGKKEVAKAIAAIYNVSPKKVNIVNTKGKVKGTRFKGLNGTTKSVKKAYVTLKEGDKIEFVGA